MADAVSTTAQPAQVGQQPQDAPAYEDRRTWATRVMAEIKAEEKSLAPYEDDEGGPGDWEGDAWMYSRIEPSGDVSVV